MKSRPILFSAPMIRALVAGTKTQTRRIVKRPPALRADDPMCIEWVENWKQYAAKVLRGDNHALAPCNDTYGQPGDRLWVRETWQAWDKTSHEYDEYEPWSRERRGNLTFSQYHAERGMPDAIEYEADSASTGPWNPSIHMPRWASRITLGITGIRCERLNEISEEDAKDEGVVGFKGNPHPTAVDAYCNLWESINGPGSWDANPWVWVISFKQVTP